MTHCPRPHIVNLDAGILRGVRSVLFMHAHPDDESGSTGALIAALVDAGVAVDVVTSNRGERGEVVPGPLDYLEGTPALERHRRLELAAALSVLGVRHHCFLGTPPARAQGLAPRVYRDSGMRWIAPGQAGPAADSGPDSFSVVAPDEEIADLRAWLDTHRVDLVISYDEFGGYGHPDHVRSQEIARAAARAEGIRFAHVVHEPGPGVEWFDLTAYLPTKVAAMRQHQSQMTVTGTQVMQSGGQITEITARCGLQEAG